MPDEAKPEQPDAAIGRKEKVASFHIAVRSLQEHDRSVRMWFLAYAVGGLAVFVSTEGAWAAVRASTCATVTFCMALVFFFLAIATQVIGKICGKQLLHSAVLDSGRILYPDAPWPTPVSVSRLTRYVAKFSPFRADIFTFACLIFATIIVVVLLLTHDPAASPVPTTLPVP